MFATAYEFGYRQALGHKLFCTELVRQPCTCLFAGTSTHCTCSEASTFGDSIGSN